MESSKKHSFSDQILSSRRRVLTRFGLGVGVSLTAFTVLFLTNSINGPFVSPMFKGINDAVGFSFSSSFNGSSTSVEQGKEKEKVEGANMSFPLPYQDLVNTQLRNSSHVSNITVVETKQNETQQVKNVPSIVVVVSKNETSYRSDDEISVDIEKTYFSNSTTQDLKTSNGGFDEGCDIYDGKWVRDDSKPLYPAGSCPYIDKDFDCHLNGRLDDEFLKWKWQPNGCDIPSLNGTDFLERLRGKKLVFVGDSLNRNMWESLVCILRHSVKNKERVFEISGKTKFKKKGFYAFRFEDYNCTVDFVGSPFLVQESTYKSQNGSFETLRLDLMDKSTSMYHDADIIVFNTGHWWTHEKTSKGEDYYQEGDYVHHQLKVLEAYKRALTTWARWVDKNIDSTRTLVIFRGYSVTHFRGGPWNLGGQCHNETEPFLDTKYLRKYPSKMRALGNILHDMRTPVVYMNISRLTDFRKDGHPSIYRLVYKTSEEREVALKHQDCSHWCLPGVPDTWNELLYVSLLMAEKRKN